ncbi:hypothetical protein [Patiriisocius sp. Uisw_017]|jgi:hypothetical protein|uniref:hypothetical protein n=1 Tax=Patiriisocius sp. Uisw_017 TaxID=3230968 RepID=UPI0039ED384D
MKKIYFLLSMFFISCWSFAQVGINTNTPEGILDINSNNMGIIYPVVSLTDVFVETISNPKSGIPFLVAGTTVYNTNNSSIGPNSVSSGIYIWNGTKWIPSFSKDDNILAVQNSNFRSEADLGAENIDFNVSSFTPSYSGIYRIVITVNFGGGRMRNITAPFYQNFGAQGGTFSFNFNSNTSMFSVNSLSGRNNDNTLTGIGDSVFENKFHQVTYIVEESLVKNTTYNFVLSYDMDENTDFTDNGNSSNNGRGFIRNNNDLVSTIEFNYIDD